MKIKAGIVGVSGLAGANLKKLLGNHDKVGLKVVSQGEVQDDQKVYNTPIAQLNNTDITFLAVPHGKAKDIASKLECKVIDLSADHRLTNTYGLPEIFKEEISKANLVANPGCYATSCILVLYPIKDSIDHVVFNCQSGYSGGGKNPKYDYQNNIIAYKLKKHFHVNEIEKILSIPVSFTPYVVDTYAGIMCTATIFSDGELDPNEVKNQYKDFYSGTFTKVIDDIPNIKKVVNTPYCYIGGFVSDHNGALKIISVLDNLMKGSASQAIENMNLMFGLPHNGGLE